MWDGFKFDIWISGVIIVVYVIFGFFFVLMLIVLFVGGSYWCIFLLCGLISFNFEELIMWGKVIDYLWYIMLLVIVLFIVGFVMLILLIKNSFFDEICK